MRHDPKARRTPIHWCADTLEGDREFCALGCRLAALCRLAGVIRVVGREIGNFVPWGAV